MKLSVAAVFLALGLATALPSPAEVDFESLPIVDAPVEARAAEADAPRIVPRACAKDAICSGGKCYKVQCFGHNTCSRYQVSGSC